MKMWSSLILLWIMQCLGQENRDIWFCPEAAADLVMTACAISGKEKIVR